MRKFFLCLLVLCVSILGHFNLAFAESQSQSIILSFNHLTTYKSSPGLRGSISSTANLMVVVKVEGRSEVATDIFENGEWVLPENVIQPPLEKGAYNISLEAQDYDGNVLGQYFLSDAIEINDQYIPAPVVELISLADQNNEKNFNVLAKAEPDQAIEIKINDGLNTPISFSGLTDTDGTLSHAFDISELWDGKIEVSVTAVNIYNDARSGEIVKIFEKNSATLTSPNIFSEEVITSSNVENFSIAGRGTSNSRLYYYFTDSSGKILSGDKSIGSQPFYKIYTNFSNFDDGKVKIIIGLKSSSGATSKLVEYTVLKDTTGPMIYRFETESFINKNNATKFSFEVTTDPDCEILVVATEGLAPVYQRFRSNSDGIAEFDMNFSQLLDEQISIYLFAYDQYENSEQKDIKIFKDTVSPKAPQINDILENISLDFGYTRSIDGVAEAGSIISFKIFNNGIEKLSRDIKADGEGNFDLGKIDFTDFDNGQITISAISIDSFENVSDPAELVLTKSTTNPNNNSNNINSSQDTITTSSTMTTNVLSGLFTTVNPVLNSNNSTTPPGTPDPITSDLGATDPGTSLPLSGSDLVWVTLMLPFAILVARRLSKIW